VNSGTSGSASSGGLRHGLAQAGVSVLELLRTRLELASIEFAEERERTKARLILMIVAALFCAVALLCASAFVVLWFWDTHRLAAMGTVTVAYVVIGTGAALRLRASLHSPSSPFAQTLAELERDREWLSAMIRDRPTGDRPPR
jgi:uncharacterized membrane protein YqjE